MTSEKEGPKGLRMGKVNKTNGSTEERLILNVDKFTKYSFIPGLPLEH